MTEEKPKKQLAPSMVPNIWRPGQSGNPTGARKRPDWLKDAAEVAGRWMRLVVEGASGEHSRAALRVALAEAWKMGRQTVGVVDAEKVLESDVEALFEKHIVEIMMARTTEKGDLVRLRASMDLLDRYHGKPKPAPEDNGDNHGDLVRRVERVIVDPAKPALGEKKPA